MHKQRFAWFSSLNAQLDVDIEKNYTDLKLNRDRLASIVIEKTKGLYSKDLRNFPPQDFCLYKVYYVSYYLLFYISESSNRPLN